MDSELLLAVPAQKLSVQTIAYVFICVVGVYLLKSRDSYVLQATWWKAIETEYYYNGKYPGLEERTPTPIIADIDNDGLAEVIAITNNYKLELYTVPIMPKHIHEGSLPTLTAQLSTSLPVISEHGGRPSQPIALHYSNDGSSSPANTTSGALIVLFNDLRVVCFNNKLQEMWRSKLKELPKDGVVGSSAVFSTQWNSTSSERATGLFITVTIDYKGHTNLASWVEVSDTVTAAVNITTGQLIWLNILKWKESSSSPTMKALAREEDHLKQFIQVLPYQWYQVKDTRITAIKFHQRLSQNATKSRSILYDIVNLDDQFWNGLFARKQSVNDDHSIDTIVVFTRHGIELRNMSSGEVMNMTHTLKGRHTYLDHDQSGSVIELQRLGDDPCLLQARKVAETDDIIFTVNICEAPSVFSTASLIASFTETDIEDDPKHMIPPAVTPRVARKFGLFDKWRKPQLKQQRNGYDVITHTKKGRLSSWDSHGHLNWQVMVSSLWFRRESPYGYKSSFNEREVFDDVFEPSLTIIRPYSVHDMPPFALTLGWNSMNLVDLSDGYVLCEHSLPHPPMSRPVLGDFNNDGYSDMIVLFPDRYVGFTIQKQFNYLYTALTAVFVITTVLTLAWYCQPDGHNHQE